MSDFENRNGKKADAEQKIEAKLEQIDRYIAGKEYCFIEPKTFSFNWFCDLAEGELEKNSKSAKAIRRGTELKQRVDDVLRRAAEAREAKSKRGKGKTAELEALIYRLKGELKRTKAQLDAQVDENTELRRELSDLKRLEGIRQAQWNDAKKTVRNIGGD